MHHRVGNFNSGRETVKHQPANLGLQDREQIAELAQIVFRAVNGRGQMSSEFGRDFQQLGAVGMADQQGRGTENFRRQFRILAGMIRTSVSKSAASDTRSPGQCRSAALSAESFTPFSVLRRAMFDCKQTVFRKSAG